MDKNTLNQLLDKYMAGNASNAEKKLLETYYDKLSLQDAGHVFAEGEDEKLQKEMLAAILSTVEAQAAPSKTRVRRMIFIRVAAAAAVVIVAIAGFMLFRPGKEQVNKSTIATDVKPLVKPVLHGTDKAILTLGNGASITLDSAGNGALQRQGNTSITKSGSHLLYAASNSNTEAVTYNTLTTPKGGQYHVTLADGTGVWLNASSSIRFPTAFKGTERNVEITGEAYFEVAKDHTKPFHVQAGNMKVEVLGTHFNISAYNDEASINTTLVEGSVKVSAGGAAGMLRPGQQSRFNATAQSITVAEADTEKALAWMNGMLIFKRDDIKTIMRQVSRWYDVEIVYGGTIPARLYSGTISKYANIDEVLRILALGGIKFSMQGNVITVL